MIVTNETNETSVPIEGQREGKKMHLRISSIEVWLCIVVGIVFLGFGTWLINWIPRIQQDWKALQLYPTDASKKKFDASLEIAKAIVGGAGTVATISGGFVLYLNFRNAQENVRVAQEKLEQDAEKLSREFKLAESRLITDRFSKAVEQLGSEKIQVRIGGIFALERIANDSLEDYWQVMEVLTAFVREASSLSKKREIDSNRSVEAREEQGTVFSINSDITAVFDVLRRRENTFEKGESSRLNLSKTDLRGLDLERNERLCGIILREANLKGANLKETNLQKADLQGANLQEAHLQKANLQEADLTGANLQGVNLWAAQLQKAKLIRAEFQGITNLGEADLTEACLGEANLQGVNLAGATLQKVDLLRAKLQAANLAGADLREAELMEAELQGVQLQGANIEKANFKGAVDLNPEQVKNIAKNWDKAIYDDEFRKKLGLPCLAEVYEIEFRKKLGLPCLTKAYEIE